MQGETSGAGVPFHVALEQRAEHNQLGRQSVQGQSGWGCLNIQFHTPETKRALLKTDYTMPHCPLFLRKQLAGSCGEITKSSHLRRKMIPKNTTLTEVLLGSLEPQGCKVQCEGFHSICLRALATHSSFPCCYRSQCFATI